MTQEQQRIAIAEACGWRRWSKLYPGKSEQGWRKDNQPFVRNLPNYPNDLNAMHEAWKTLTPSQKVAFESHLYDVVVGGAEYHRNDDQPYITNATAAQRARAFLETLNSRHE